MKDENPEGRFPISRQGEERGRGWGGEEQESDFRPDAVQASIRHLDENVRHGTPAGWPDILFPMGQKATALSCFKWCPWPTY